MSEMTDTLDITGETPGDPIRDLQDKFIEAWGDIATMWGVNRSMGRIHALLFLSPEPQTIEAVTQRLSISHGNCSTGLRDLMSWGVVRRFHRPGERRALYNAEKDPWTWFNTCIAERRRRELGPMLVRLEDLRQESESLPADGSNTARAVRDFDEFLNEFDQLIEAFLTVGSGRLGEILRGLAKRLPARKKKRAEG